MLSILDLSKKILSCSKDSITLLKLQKLCYYCQAWHYAFYGAPLIKEEFMAEKYGAATDELREYSRAYLFDRISSSGLAFSCDFEGDEIPPDSKIVVYLQKPGSLEIIDQNYSRFIEAIHSVYDIYDGETLSEMNHDELPWILARLRELNSPQSVTPIILGDEMRNYYSEQQPFRGLISRKLKEIALKLSDSFNYVKVQFNDDGKYDLIYLSAEDRKPIQCEVDKLVELGKLVEKKLNFAEFDGRMNVFSKLDNNIVLLPHSLVEDYIMNTANAIIEKIQRIIGKTSPHITWEYSDSEPDAYYYSINELELAYCGSGLDDIYQYVCEHIADMNRYFNAKSKKEEFLDDTMPLFQLFGELLKVSPDSFKRFLKLDKIKDLEKISSEEFAYVEAE